MDRTVFRTCIFALLASIIASSFAFAQRLSGELHLQVVDPTGAGIHSTATIVGQATGVDRTFETDEMGKFTIRGLPLGKYELSIGSQGFVPKTEAVEIDSVIPSEHLVSLELTPVKVTIDVQDVDTLFDPV